MIASTLSGCITDNSSKPTTIAGLPQDAQDSPCDRVENAALLGLVGAAAGVGLALAFHEKGAVVAGAGLAGALLGSIIGRDMDTRACAEERIARKAGVTVEHERIMATTPAADSSQKKEPEATQVGHVTRWQDSGFAPGSAELTPQAREYFSSSARLYLPKPPDQQELNGLQGDKRVDYLATLEARNSVPILLVGNTDDIGSSRNNQQLSEARARAVGDVFRAAGIDPSRIFYWGAGETRPVADNRTEDGRARNRRVDMIEFQSRDIMLAYLRNDRPNTQYYRPPEREDSSAAASMRAEATAPGKTPSLPRKTRKSAEPKTSPQATVPAETQSSDSSGHGAAETKQGTMASTTSTEVTSVPAKVKVSAPTVKESGEPIVDFGGVRVETRPPSLYDKAGGAKPAGISFGLISKAFATTPPTASCADDRARRGGQVKSLSNDQPLDFNTADVLPGLNNVAWGSTVNDNLVVMVGMTVLRDSSRPISNPRVDVFPRWSRVRDKRAANPAYSLSTTVNTYEAKDGFVYRVFVDERQNVMSCVDLLIPYSGFKSSEGRLFYYMGNTEYMASYAPKKL
jgi:outer membrane protein OmpA-like peptidoglycan-associated protein